VRLAAVPLAPDTRLVLVAQIGVVYSEPMAQQLLRANNRLANLTRELARQSAELDAARTRFESLADLREHFVSMLAHDLRGATPAGPGRPRQRGPGGPLRGGDLDATARSAGHSGSGCGVQLRSDTLNPGTPS
jgi:hypothetical protein